MRLLALFLKARLSERAALGLVITAGAAWLWGWLLSETLGALQLAMLLFPMLCGSILGVATASPFPELERTASRRLSHLRALQLAMLCGVAAAILLVASWTWPEPDAWLVITRNLSGFIGLSLLSAVLLGSHMAWVVPACYGFSLIAFVGEDSSSLWRWAFSPPGDDGALRVTLVLFLVAFALVSRYGTREPANAWA